MNPPKTAICFFSNMQRHSQQEYTSHHRQALTDNNSHQSLHSSNIQISEGSDSQNEVNPLQIFPPNPLPAVHEVVGYDDINSTSKKHHRQKLLQTHTRSVTGNSEVEIKKEESIKEQDAKEIKKDIEKKAIFDALNSPCINTFYELEKMTM